jgi:hypothetical protein
MEEVKQNTGGSEARSKGKCLGRQMGITMIMIIKAHHDDYHDDFENESYQGLMKIECYMPLHEHLTDQ